MICKKCGKEIENNAKFCEYCGTAVNQTVENQPSDSPENPVPVNSAAAPAVQKSPKKSPKSVLKTIAIVIAVVAVLLIITAVVTMCDNKSQDGREAKIKKVQESYFEFLPEMTVGDIITEYYGENYWVCNEYDAVEFFGTNQKDNSGLSLHFAFTQTAGVVDVTYIKYHNENEAAHDISKQEFETYILSLYDRLDEDKKSAQKTAETTVTTTAKKTSAASETAKTTTAKKNEDKEEKSDKYMVYLSILNEMDSEFKNEYGNEDILYYYYYLYDINHDGTYELLMHIGESEAEAVIMICSLDEDGKLIDLGEIGGGHTALVEKDGKLYTNFGHSGIQRINEVVMYEDLGSWIVVTKEVSEESGLSDYKSYGTGVKWYYISDTSGVEALCPEDALNNKPYVEAYAETYDYSGRDGYFSEVYLSGDFAYVKIVSSYDQYGYEDDVMIYTYEEVQDGIVVYEGSDLQVPTLLITPYNEFDVPGDIVTCYVPRDISGTIIPWDSFY